jgi:hypothetical protein
MRGVAEVMEGELLEANGESLPLASTCVGREPWGRRRICVMHAFCRFSLH